MQLSQEQQPIPGLRAARRKVRLTQEQLADLTGLSIFTIARIDRSLTYVPTENVRQRIAGALGLPESELWPQLKDREED